MYHSDSEGQWLTSKLLTLKKSEKILAIGIFCFIFSACYPFLPQKNEDQTMCLTSDSKKMTSEYYIMYSCLCCAHSVNLLSCFSIKNGCILHYFVS